MRKSKLSYEPFVREFYFLITISTFFACTQNRPDQHEALSKENTPKPPVTITAKAPFVTLLDTCPPPRTIAIPQTTSESYGIKTGDGSKILQILPPERLSAGFFLSVQNLTTINGLTHNSVTKGYIDRKGNLWLGTYDGGVSRYDGKTFTNLTTVQGLTSNKIWDICEDKAGNLWFSTWDGGVSCYDGKSFTKYTTAQGLADNLVCAVMEDKDGNMWFGTAGGVSRLNHDGSIKSYTTDDGLVGNNVSSILQDKNGNFWFGTWSHGLSFYNGTFMNYTAEDGLANNTIGSILQDKDGTMWFGSGRGKISWLDKKNNHPAEKPRFRNYNLGEGLSDVNNVSEDKNGNIWFGTDGGAFRLSSEKKSNPDKGSFMNITIREGLPNNMINGVIEDDSGNMWIFTDNGGVSLVYRGLTFLTSLAVNEKLLHHKVSSVLQDKAGNIWIGTLAEGALRLSDDGKSLLRYGTSQGLPDDVVLNIFEDKSGNLWFAGRHTISRLDRDGKSLTNYTTAHGLPKDNWILKIFEDKSGNIWFGTFQGGVCRLSVHDKFITRYTTAQGLVHDVVWAITEDKNGNLWFGTDGGISILGGNGSFNSYTTADGLASDNVRSIFQDKGGNLWIGTWDGGVSRFDGTSFTSYTTTQGLSNNRVRDVAMDSTGMIWLGTEKGFTVLKGFVVETNSTLNTSGRHYLQPSNVLSNAELERNNFKPDFEIYNPKSGYLIEEISSNILVTREGIIWAGTGGHEKTVRFDYSKIHKNPNPPVVFIQGIKINNEVISWYDLSHETGKTENFSKTPNGIEEITQFGKILDEQQRKAMRKKFNAIRFDSISRFYPVPVNLVLPYEHNNITFDFAAIEPARPGFVRYQYMMEGYEKEWSPVTDKTSVTYGNIHEGSYAFKLKVQSPDGVWSKPLTYTFKVLPPWWRTWWFMLTAVGCLVTLFYLIIRWQKLQRQLERSEKEKQVAEMKQKNAELQHKTAELEMQALRAQMNPHFIFNSLNSVNMFILENNKSQASEYLSKFSRLVRLILHHSQESFIPLDRELEALRLYLELESLRFEKKFNYKISVRDVDTMMAKVPPLVIQPYAENAIWHGLMQKKEKGHLEIEIYSDAKLLFCKISDDGIGREKAAELKSKSSLPYKSMGMRITADRLAMLQQQGNIENPIAVRDLLFPDGNAAGTEVVIKLPLHYD